MDKALWHNLLASWGLCLVGIAGGCTTISTAGTVVSAKPQAAQQRTMGRREEKSLARTGSFTDKRSRASIETDSKPALPGASAQAEASVRPAAFKDESAPDVSSSAIQLIATTEGDALQESPHDERRIKFSERLKIPAELPGADAPPISLPPFDPDQPTARKSAIESLFPELGTLTADAEPAAGRGPMSLSELENLALQNHPTLTQAASDIDAATGDAIQAGMYPNPKVGYEADTVGSAGTRNYQGLFLTQTIKTAGKLDLARSAANVDLMNSQLAYRKARADLLSRVRARYFSVMVAAENLVAAEALTRFANEAYRVQVEQLEGGQAAAYEPMQLRVEAVKSRAALVMARNKYIAEWKQLAAAIGVPELPAARLTGRADMGGPAADYEAALAYLTNNHTDVLSARNAEHRERIKLRLAEVTPIPDVEVYTAIQKDFTTPPVTRTTYNLQVGVPVPLFDRNRGGIRSAQGALVRASEESNRVRLDLTSQLADVFARYESARSQLLFYRDRILPDQARSYQGVYQRHQQEPDQVGFADVVAAQQNLQNAVATYLAALGDHWQAYVELAALLQLEDLAQFPAAR